MNSTKTKIDLIDIINEMGEDIDNILIDKKQDRYIEGIAINFSFIENLLKYIVFLNKVWEQNCIDTDNEISREECENNYRKILKECSGYDFKTSNKKAFCLDIFNDALYNQIEKIREERNDMIHQLWIYSKRKDYDELEKYLHELVGISKELVNKFVKISKKIGLNEVFDISLLLKLRKGKKYKIS